MVDKDQGLGWLVCIVCVATAATYTVALFWPALEAIRLWLVAIPVLIAFTAILAIGACIEWTMATTPPPKPILKNQTLKPHLIAYLNPNKGGPPQLHKKIKIRLRSREETANLS